MRSLQDHPTHILEVIHPSSTWFRDSDVYNTVMGGVFGWLDGHSHIWRHRWHANPSKCLLSFQKHEGNHEINNIEISAHYPHFALISRNDHPLSTILVGQLHHNLLGLTWFHIPPNHLHRPSTRDLPSLPIPLPLISNMIYPRCLQGHGQRYLTLVGSN